MNEPESAGAVRSLARVRAALAPWDDTPDGVLFAGGGIVVDKRRRQVRLFFGEAIPDRPGLDLSGVMARIDLDRPLALLGTYAQAMMLSLAWTPEPRRVHVLGLGGGRLSMLFHHHFPQATVDSTEIDPNVVKVACRFFGLVPDARQRVFAEDGRAFLERAPERYDVVLIDVFGGVGVQPPAFASEAFYRLCLDRLSEDGVVATNLLASDPDLQTKVRAFAAAFPYAWRFEGDGSTVAFGSRRLLSQDELERRAGEAATRHGFDFPFLEHLLRLAPPSRTGGSVHNRP